MGARRAVTGAQIFEIGSPDNGRKADALAERLCKVLGDKEGVRITRPTQMFEVHIRDLDDSVVSADVVVASVGGCSLEDIKAGDMRSSGRGLGTIWV